MDKTGKWISEHVTAHDVFHHGINAVLESRKSAFQEILIVDSASSGKTLILDGHWQSSTNDEFLYHEPLVHPACVSAGGPRDVLVLGGGEGATVREVLRWKTVQRVVMVELDEQVVEVCRQHLPEVHRGAFDDPRTQLVIADALDYLDMSDTRARRFDVVICDLSDPVENGPSSNLFTREYFERMRRILTPGGCFAVQAGSVAPIDLHLHTRLISTLKTVFEHVAPYASFVPSFLSAWGFALGSDRPIHGHQDPAAVDRLLIDGMADAGQSLRMFDGQTMQGMFQPPRHIRQAIEQERHIYTLARPARLTAQGVVQE